MFGSYLVTIVDHHTNTVRAVKKFLARSTCGPLVPKTIDLAARYSFIWRSRSFQVCLSTMAEEERCIFCKIAQGKDEKTTLLYQVSSRVILRYLNLFSSFI